MRLLLVRHGESEWNATRRLQGQADIALSERGCEQARRLRPVIEALAPDLAVASDLLRAAETARLLGVEASPEPGLREIDVGAWTGAEIAQLQADAADDYLGWRAGTFAPPGGELWADFRARVTAAVARAAADAGAASTVLAVCHGGVIRALVEHHLGIAPRSVIPVGPASVTSLRMAPDGATRLELFNYTPGTLDMAAPD